MLSQWIVALSLAGSALGTPAQTGSSSDFIALPASVAVGRLPQTAPFLFGNTAWTQVSDAGCLLELTNPVAATARSGNLVHRNAAARVSRGGRTFDKNRNLYDINELVNAGRRCRHAGATTQADKAGARRGLT